MPRAAAAKSSAQDASLQDLSREIAALLLEAMRFVAPDRGQAIARKWANPRDLEKLPEQRMIGAVADAMLLSTDLLLSQPAASGMTAFDRLARSRGNAPAEAAAIAALRQARFRLLRLEGDASLPEPTARDVISGETLRIINGEMPPLPAETALFARVAMLGDGRCCLPGAITPLDAAAFAVARGHQAAGAPVATAGARWAEAVYAHVVRNGTLEIPGLNRPSSDFDADEHPFAADDIELLEVAMEWAALADAMPNADLLQRTRELTNLPSILNALCLATTARDAGEAAMTTAVERLLQVQMETVLRREQGGSSGLTLDAVGRALDRAIAEERLSPKQRALFATLRQRLDGGSSARRDDPALERLVQRIQGLRAKTVAQGCTEQEALAAAEKVAELLDRYGLSLDELEFRAQPCDGIGIETNRRRFAPIDDCIPAIAAFFDCQVWVERAKGAALRYVFFGLRGDVAAARYLYEMVERAFETETQAFRAGDLYAEMAGERRSAVNSFQIGLSRGISGKLAAMQSARNATRRSASGRDLVPMKAAIVDEEVAKLGLDLRARQMGQGKRVLTDAFAAGQAAGQRFEFIPAITQAA